jgi:hypothetical protein
MLEKSAHKMRHGRVNPNYDEASTKVALKMLGRREDIPDWVAVGASDQFKRGMLFQTAA